MLVLSRKRDERIVIGDNIVITIVDVRGDKVRVGIEAPADVPVHRQEIADALKRNAAPPPQPDTPRSLVTNRDFRSRIVTSVRCSSLAFAARPDNCRSRVRLLMPNLRKRPNGNLRLPPVSPRLRCVAARRAPRRQPEPARSVAAASCSRGGPRLTKANERSFGRAKACILLFMWGGPAHQDTWDLKPDAPGRDPRRVQADRDERPRHSDLRALAAAGHARATSWPSSAR